MRQGFRWQELFPWLAPIPQCKHRITPWGLIIEAWSGDEREIRCEIDQSGTKVKVRHMVSVSNMRDFPLCITCTGSFPEPQKLLRFDCGSTSFFSRIAGAIRPDLVWTDSRRDLMIGPPQVFQKAALQRIKGAAGAVAVRACIGADWADGEHVEERPPDITVTCS